MNKMLFSVSLAAVVAGSMVVADDAEARRRRPAPPPQPYVDPNQAEWDLIQFTKGNVEFGTGAGVTVAVFDGVTDCSHSDFSGRCTNNYFDGGRYRGSDSHGTHTAGTIGSESHGVAPDVNILSYGVFDRRTFVPDPAGLVAGWQDAYDKGARIVNMSFGCDFIPVCFDTVEWQGMADIDMLFVKSSGNDGFAHGSESAAISFAAAEEAMSKFVMVGSVSTQAEISSFSNTPGTGCLMYSGATGCADSLLWANHFIVAPGESIFSTLPGGTFGSMSGTSMAAPVVSGAAALLMAKWPTLQADPAQVAQILFASAQDLGAPGVDAVYGHGLLDLVAAFQPIGPTAMMSADGVSTVVANSVTTISPTMSRFASAIAPVTVYDRFGRDYSIAQTSNVGTRVDFRQARQMLGKRLLGQGMQADWAAPMFAAEYAPRSFAMFHSPAESNANAFTPDRSLRMGVDMPFAGGVAALRMTGATASRMDFAYDPTLRPLSFFSSTSLLKSSMVGHALINLGANERLSVYGTATTGSMTPAFETDPMLHRLISNSSSSKLALDGTPLEMEQQGVGVGYWLRPDAKTVVGFNASVMNQKGGYYDLVSDLDSFNKSTRMFNLGAAVSRGIGNNWELTAATELTHLRMQRNGALGFTPANLVSGEVSLRKAGVAFSQPDLQDSFAVSFVVPPQAVSGNLEVEYLTRTPDGMGRQLASHVVPLAMLGSNPMKVEAAYRLTSGDNWSFDLSGGVNLKEDVYAGRGELLASFRLGL